MKIRYLGGFFMILSSVLNFVVVIMCVLLMINIWYCDWIGV